MKTFALHVGTALAFMMVLTTVGLWSAPKLMAAIKAALVQNVDEPGRNPHGESNTGTCALNQCVVRFSTVPAGKRFVVSSISGRFATSAAGVGSEVKFSTFQDTNYVYFLPATFQGLGLYGPNSHVVNQTLMAYVDSGIAPSLSIGAYGGTIVDFSITFTIAGYYVSLQ